MDRPIHIGVVDLRGCIIYAFDINNLLSDPQSLPMISARVSANWVRGVHDRLVNCGSFGFDEPRFATSEYAKTNRAARSTFSVRHTDSLLPLELPVAQRRWHQSGDLAYGLEGIRISPQGAISVRIEVKFARSRAVLHAADVVHAYHHLSLRTSSTLVEAVSALVSLWNARGMDIKLTNPRKEDLLSVVRSYDIWDYDVVQRSGDATYPVTSVKGLYAAKDTTAARELTAIANMDIADVESLKDVRLEQFTRSDIGTRDDELWSIGRERMTRRHPERKVSFNIAFFHDVKLATEILVGYQATLEFLEDWVRRQRRSLLDEILRFKDLTELRQQDLERRYSDVIRASQILVEPLALEREVKHGFFAQVIVELTRVLELDGNLAHSTQALAEFAALVESLSGFHDAELNAKLGGIQVQLGENSRRLALLGVVLTLIGLFVGAAQVWVAIQLSASPGDTRFVEHSTAAPTAGGLVSPSPSPNASRASVKVSGSPESLEYESDRSPGVTWATGDLSISPGIRVVALPAHSVSIVPRVRR